MSSSLIIIDEANFLSASAGLPYTISSLQQCNFEFYHDLYSYFTGKMLCSLKKSEEEKCRTLIEALEEYFIPFTNLDHIEPYRLVRHDELTVKHVLGVFSVLFCSPSSVQESSSVDAGLSVCILTYLK